ncbi:N-acetylmuramic acid 6-phosphate etherase [Synechococcus sp. MIT S9509]|uniref:N-acetylmuramic acid 6-phosphate etherase n=1 Tax=unclassified Synechococcus TaxID=2626047 RepID=UPI0007BC732E|nr:MULTISPECIES: N-acetylmuramic acid 6-phosphate etherase [unclassified Synechococcus]KZR87984.1 N-acetylmuramic acid 6-phosphate etherase [Synechococcus sp. MIT S9504]KZR92231.1 N-acetylmuramic acid 6-phosphate etherase [Synechococcus sp. MIT S9509]
MSESPSSAAVSSSPLVSPSEDRGYLLTEQVNPASDQLDQLSTDALVDLFIDEDLKPQQAVFGARRPLSLAIDAIAERLQRSGRLFYLGAGTSGRLGVLDAAECPPTFCSPPELVQGILAGGAPALLRSSEGLEDLESAAVSDLQERGFGSEDCLVGIAAGGTTPYVRGGLSYAKKLGALTIAMACVPSEQAPLPCAIDVRLLTGPELLTGSTRLKAGTATKMALNILSTGVMVRLGKVYGNRMVDVAASNSKLVDRSMRILRDLLGVKREVALGLLERAQGSVKRALLMGSCNLEADEADALLEAHGADLRAAIVSQGQSLPVQGSTLPQ